MPPRRISLHQLPLPDSLTVIRSLINVEARVCRFNLIAGQLAPPERVIQHICHLCFTALAVLDNSVAIFVTRVKFRFVNYSCTPFLHFLPPLVSFPLQIKQTTVKRFLKLTDTERSGEQRSFLEVAILSLSRRFCQALLGLDAFMLATTVHFSPFHFVWSKCNKAAKQWNW